MGGYDSNSTTSSGSTADLITLPNVTALRADIGAAGFARALRGFSTVGDGGEGLFVWDPNNGIDDGGIRFNAGGLGSNGPGWVRSYNGPRSIKFYGALGDGTTNDTTAIDLALNSLKNVGGGELFFPEGIYLTDGINLDGPGSGWANIRLTGEAKRSSTAGGSIIKSRAGTGGGAPATQQYVLRSAGQNIISENITFDGNFSTLNAVVFFDYQTVGSGLYKCFVCKTYEPAAIIVTADNTTDTFNAVGHGLADGDQIYFKSTISLPTEIFGPANFSDAPEAEGAYNWVWYVVNATANTFQIEYKSGAGVWTFTTDGSGVITAHKVGASLVRIGGASGLQADTGTIRDCFLVQDPGDFSRLAGRAIFISDVNAVLWDIQKCHIQGFVDGIWVRGGGCSVRECTLFGFVAVSRSHLVKDGQTSLVHISDETYTEVDAVTWLVDLGGQLSDYNQPWVMDFPFLNVGRGNINWDCHQPLQLRGGMGGDCFIRSGGEQLVYAFGITFPLVGATIPAFKGELARLIRIGQTDRSHKVITEIRRIGAPSPDPLEPGENGFGLFLSGGESADYAAGKKEGALVLDLGEARTTSGFENQSAKTIFARRQEATITITNVDTATDVFTSNNHGLTFDDTLELSSTVSIPTSLIPKEDYWALPIDANTFKLAYARKGTALNITGAGAGVITAKILKSFCAVVFDLSNLAGLSNASRFDSVGPLYFSALGNTLVLSSAAVAASRLVSQTTLSVGTSVLPSGNGEAFFDYDGAPSDGGAYYLHTDANNYGVLYNFDKTGSKYLRSGKGAGYSVFDATTGGFIWYTAPTGTAGNAITLTERMRLLQGGGLTCAAFIAPVFESDGSTDAQYRGPYNGDGTYAARVQGFNGSVWQTGFRVNNVGSGNIGVWINEAGGALRFFDTSAGATKQTITGVLSAVIDPNAKTVLTSIINALVAYGLVADGTT